MDSRGRGPLLVTTSVEAERPTPLHPWDGFLLGPENALAQASVLALARGESAGVSPLVVHGPSGVGKSRLLAGLVGERLLREPGSSVSHVEAEGFAASCAEAAVAPGVGPTCERGSGRSTCSYSKTSMPSSALPWPSPN